MSACVVASNSQPGWMFLFGVIMASCFWVSRSIRVGRVGAVTVGSGTGTTASESTLHIPARGRVALGMRGNYEPAIHEPTGSRPQLHSRERLRTSTDEPKARRAPTKHCNQTKKEVQSAMLRPIQQDLLSALVNLKVPYADAYRAALANTSASFDEAFKVALADLNAGKSRAAA